MMLRHTFTVCLFLLLAIGSFSQNICGKKEGRLLRQSQKQLNKTKPDTTRAKEKLQKCLSFDQPCFDCNHAYINLIFEFDSLKSEATRIIEFGLSIWPHDLNLVCKKFSLLKVEYENLLNDKNAEYQNVLSILIELEEIAQSGVEDCNIDKKWSNEIVNWSEHLANSKFELMSTRAMQLFEGGFSNKSKKVISQMLSMDFLGDQARQSYIEAWCLDFLFKIAFNHKDYVSARIRAQSLIDMEEEVPLNQQRICECDMQMALLAKNNGKYDDAIDLLENYKNSCISYDEEFYNEICIEFAMKLLDTPSRDGCLKALELVDQINCISVINQKNCDAVSFIRYESYLFIGQSSLDDGDYKNGFYYIHPILEEFPDDIILRELYFELIALKIEKTYDKGRNYDHSRMLELFNQIECEQHRDTTYCDKLDRLKQKVYLSLTNKYLKNGEFSTAYNFLNAILLEYPENKKLLKQKNKIVLSHVSWLSNEGAIESLELCLSLLKLANCDDLVKPFDCNEIREAKKEVYILIYDYYLDQRQCDKALEYINIILMEFPENSYLKRLKADVCFELGEMLKQDFKYDLAIGFFSILQEDSLYGAQSEFKIAQIYQNAFEFDEAIKYYEKAANSALNASENADSLQSMAIYNKARLLAMKGDSSNDRAMNYLADYGEPFYSMHRELASKDDAFYNLRNKLEFQYWIEAKRRIKYNGFSLKTDYNTSMEVDLPEFKTTFYDNEDAPIFYLPPKESSRVSNEGFYEVNWDSSYIRSYDHPKVLEKFHYQLIESDAFFNDKFGVFYGEIKSNQRMNVNYTDTFTRFEMGTNKIYKFIFSFNAKDSYNDWEEVSDKIVLPYDGPSVLQTFVEVVICFVHFIIPPQYLLTFKVAKAILYDNQYELSPDGVEDAVAYFLKQVSPSSFNTYNLAKLGECLYPIIRTLKIHKWNPEFGV